MAVIWLSELQCLRQVIQNTTITAAGSARNDGEWFTGGTHYFNRKKKLTEITSQLKVHAAKTRNTYHFLIQANKLPRNLNNETYIFIPTSQGRALI